MPAISLDSRDLFEYNPRHGVLICRECRYAIQKSALQSHLLRHKIYRGERQRLLSAIGRYELCEPEDVSIPDPNLPPVENLPVISGLRCTADGCGSLCASSKRMRRHLSEAHGLTRIPTDIGAFARPANIQTFFRGTKLRYFEVSSAAAADRVSATPATSIDHSDNDEDGAQDEMQVDAMQRDEIQQGPESKPVPHSAPGPPLTDTLQSPPALAGAAESDSRPQLRSESSNQSASFSGFTPFNLDLDTLKHFHYFMTVAYLTLPDPVNPGNSARHWQVDVVKLSFEHRWLMCGLLTISACHRIMFDPDKSEKQTQIKHMFQFYEEWTNGHEQATCTALGDQPKQVDSQMEYVINAAIWALAGTGDVPGPAQEWRALPGVLSFRQIMRQLIFPNSASGSTSGQESVKNSPEDSLAQASKLLDVGDTPDTDFPTPSSTGENTPPPLRNILLGLPTRMVEVLGEWQSLQDRLAVLSAISAILDSCEITFAGDELALAWRGQSLWLTRISDRFSDMVLAFDPSALVVVAYWAAILVKRCEFGGNWFCKGATNMILRQIGQELGPHPHAAPLVANLMPSHWEPVFGAG